MNATIIITTATLLATVLGMSDNASTEFAYNTELNNNVVSGQTVFRKDDSGRMLSRQLKYNFTYDAQNRLAQKEVLRWNENTRKWVNDHCLNYQYTTNGYSVEYVRWNAKAEAYCDVTEKTVYEQNIGDQQASYQNYQWDGKTGGWKLKTEHATLDLSNVLFAESR